MTEHLRFGGIVFYEDVVGPKRGMMVVPRYVAVVGIHWTGNFASSMNGKR